MQRQRLALQPPRSRVMKLAPLLRPSTALLRACPCCSAAAVGLWEQRVWATDVGARVQRRPALHAAMRAACCIVLGVCCVHRALSCVQHHTSRAPGHELSELGVMLK